MRLDIDLQPIKEQIQRFTIKPFATDYVVFGDWRVAAQPGDIFCYRTLDIGLVSARMSRTFYLKL